MKPELIERYVESGILRMEWRDFQYQGLPSYRAALAARAAQEQDEFWAYNELLFENQGTGFGDEALVGFAQELGLDVEQFEESLQTEEHAALIEADFIEGQRLGLTGTPSFVINDRLLVGAQPLETFEQVIEEAEREAEGG